MDLGGGALEELDVARADALAVLRQRLVGGVVTRKQNERVTGRSTVGLVNEQDPVLAVQHVHRRQALLEELQLQHNTHTTSTRVLRTKRPSFRPPRPARLPTSGPAGRTPAAPQHNILSRVEN